MKKSDLPIIGARRRSLACVVLICLLSIFFLPAQAEMVTLKSGKTIEGAIIEKTDEYIRIEIDGVAIKYYLDEIERIEGEPSPGASADKGKIFYSETEDPEKWQEWFKPRQDYIKTSQDYLREASGVAAKAGYEIDQVLKKGDFKGAVAANSQAQEKIEKLIAGLQRLTPPEGLEPHLEKAIATCEYLRKALDAQLGGNTGSAALRLTAVTLAMDAVKALKQLYKEHGASDESLDALESMINECFLAKPAS